MGRGRDGSVTIHQNAAIYAAKLGPGEQSTMPLQTDRRVWLHVASGRVQIKGYTLEAGDSGALVRESELTLDGLEAAEVLVFDLV